MELHNLKQAVDKAKDRLFDAELPQPIRPSLRLKSTRRRHVTFLRQVKANVAALRPWFRNRSPTTAAR